MARRVTRTRRKSVSARPARRSVSRSRVRGGGGGSSRGRSARGGTTVRVVLQQAPAVAPASGLMLSEAGRLLVPTQAARSKF